MKSAPWMFILVGAIAGVIIAIVTKGRWKDRGFMLTKDGKHELKWEASRSLVAFPLGVWISDDLDVAWFNCFKKLRLYVNDVIGKEIFSFAVSIPPEINKGTHLNGHILIFPGDSDDSATTELKWNKKSGEITSAVVTVPQSLHEEKAWPVLLHEVGGHCLGLAHDEQIESIMHPRIQDRKQFYTASDKKRLRNAYGK